MRPPPQVFKFSFKKHYFKLERLTKLDKNSLNIFFILIDFYIELNMKSKKNLKKAFDVI